MRFLNCRACHGSPVAHLTLFEVTLAMKMTTDEAGIEHIHIDKKVSGGINVPSEDRPLDGAEREEEDKIFGHVVRKASKVPIDEITDEFLKKDWTADTIENGIVVTESWSSPDKNKHQWRMVQTGGFGTVNGERRHVVLSTFTADKKEDPIHTRFVYDYLGPI
ncbi:hypothetical protein JVU11DRAFT_234 [Chiua virens]|nr:hypothetical protein JVU11DRAFT_234 [Chiua virens]